MSTRTPLALLAASAVAAAGCSKSSSETTTPPPPADTARIASPLPAGSTPGLASWAQGVRAEDQGGELFPGHANTWEVGHDHALGSGYGLEYGFAMYLTAGRTTHPATSDPGDHFTQLYVDWAQLAATGLLNAFPFDQNVTELTYLSPVFTAADGLVTAVVTTAIGTAPANPPVASALAGNLSGFVVGTADSRLVQTVTLSFGQTYTLAWLEQVSLAPDRFDGSADLPYGGRWQVVLRDPASGAALADPLLVLTTSSATPDLFEPTTVHTVTLLAPVAHTTSVDVSFELRSAARNDGPVGYAAVDAVTLTTAGGPNVLSNGDFEQGLTGWRAAGGGQPQNVRGAPRVVPLDPLGATTVAITRSFYATPTSTWGRYVDVFQNDHDAEVVTTVVYAMLYSAVDLTGWSAAASAKALVGRDTTGGVRDVAIVYGSGFASWEPPGTGSTRAVPDTAFVVHKIQIPAHGKAALVHFVVQLGQGADQTGLDHATTGTDAECQKIVDGFRAPDPTYRQDLEAGVLSLVKNL